MPTEAIIETHPTEVIIETHVDAALKQQAELILAAEGYTIERMFQNVLYRTVSDQALPYGLFGPNAETREAMEELRTGGGKSFATVADLMADLHEDD
jgi:DNA-damage-inducible protein J